MSTTLTIEDESRLYKLMTLAVHDDGYDPQFLVELFRQIAICAFQEDDLGIAVAISLMPDYLGEFVLDGLTQ